MIPRMRGVRVCVLLAVLGAPLLGGCGGSGAITRERVRAYAHAVNLRQSDLLLELQASKRHPEEEMSRAMIEESVRDYSWRGGACLPSSEASTRGIQQAAGFQSPVFGEEEDERVEEEEVFVRSQVTVWPSVKLAELEARGPTRDDLACMSKALDRERGLRACHAVQWLPPATPRAEGVVGTRSTCLLTKPPRGGWPDVHWDFLSFRVGQAVIGLTVAGSRGVSAAGEHELLATLYSRARAQKL